MRMLLFLGMLGAGAYAVFGRRPSSGRPAPAAFAADQTGGGDNPVRDAGPDAMRDTPQDRWSQVDEASDQSFPASDPPATY